MTNVLEQLKSMSTVVADTGEFNAIKQFQPQDATTNPSLLFKVAQQKEYQHLINEAADWAKQQGGNDQDMLSHTVDKFAITVGKEILNVIPGRVSTEVDARLSFNAQATIDKAKEIINLYEQVDTPSDRILIKIASTWEGIRAAEQLEKEGINCNLTLLFGLAQAMACADAGVYLISPFVGRILDWYKAKAGLKAYAPEEDPGVLSVTRIYNYFKQHNYHTVIMGASFRNIDQIKQLAGCDRLTISPQLLEELQQDPSSLEKQLDADNLSDQIPKQILDNERFRWHLNEDAMATEKLAEGIRLFNADQRKLEQFIQESLRQTATI